MEKNTAWAIGLSTVVLVGALVIQTKFFPNQNKKPVENQAQKTEAASEIKAENALPESENVLKASKVVAPDENLSEEKFVIENEKIKVTFTNKGGDVLNYEIKFADGKNVEMAENVSSSNRAFALSFGENAIIDDIFTAKKIDENTIGFFKDYAIKNDDGTESSFKLVKTYTFNPEEYLFKLDVNVEAGNNFKGLDFDGSSYILRTSPQIGPEYNQKDRYDVREFMALSDGKRKKTTVSPNSKKSFDKTWSWTGIGGKYFCQLVLAETPSNMGNIVYSAATDSGAKNNSQILISRKASEAKSFHDAYYVYVGPRVDKELNKYSSKEKNLWNLEGTHLNESLPTSGILSGIEIVLKFLMEMIYKVVRNWGVAIIILTAILKFAMFPLTKKTAMGTSKMGEVQPKIKALQEKYKGNPQKLNQETMKLYKEIGYNPMSGCLPMIFQFIILFAMYHLFNNYFEFRGASFIPGWIGDLSKGDTVATLKFDIPMLGNEVRILPVIYVISQLFYGKFTNMGGTANTSSQNQMKFMMYGMPIMFFFLFYNAPSGLILYWTVSNLIQLGQQIAINNMVKKQKKNK